MEQFQAVPKKWGNSLGITIPADVAQQEHIQPEKKITVLIPCHNEEKGIEKVIKGVPRDDLLRMGFETEIVVIDNNSTDKTSQIAKENNVTVLIEPKKGKGNAIKAGFSEGSR